MGRPLSPRSGPPPPGLKLQQDPYWNMMNQPASQQFSSRSQFDRLSDGQSTPVLPNVYGGDHRRAATFEYNHQSMSGYSDWPQLSPSLTRTFSDGNNAFELSRMPNNDVRGPSQFNVTTQSRQQQQPLATEVRITILAAIVDYMLPFQPINFLSLLHPSSSPPYALFVARIVKSSDQQASIFLQQKLKVADEKERAKIVDAICTKGTEMMSHR